MAKAAEEKPPKILPETHFAAGLLFEQQGQFDKAITQYRKAVALNHNYVVAFHRLGLLQSATGQHPEAAQSLQKAAALRPDNAVLHNDLGFELMRAQQWDEAERELRRAVELKPDLATAHINLALVQAKSERFAESLASFQAVLPDADAYYNLGLMFRGQKRIPEAVEAFRHVLTIDPLFTAAKIQLERLTVRMEAATSEAILAATVVEAPKPDGRRNALERYDETVITTLADLAAILAVIDAAAHTAAPTPVSVGASNHKDCDPDSRQARESGGEVTSFDFPTVDDEAVEDGEAAEKTSEEGFVEKPSTAPSDEPTEEGGSTPRFRLSAPVAVLAEARVAEEEVDAEAEAAAQFLADDPCEEEMTTSAVPPVSAAAKYRPTIVVPTEYAVAVFEEGDGDEPAAAEWIEEPSVAALTMETSESPDPCDLEFEEVDADDVIAELTVDPITLRVVVRDSWAMLEELEAKIVTLRYETQVAKAEKGGFGDWAFRYDVLMTPLTWIEQGALTLDAGADRAVAEGDEFDDFNEPFVEIDEDDTGETNGPPTPSDAVEEGLRQDPAPSDRTSLWTTQFGELCVLFSIVRNETACWDDLDAEARALLASGHADWPCVEGIEQAVQMESGEFSPVILNEPDDSMGVIEIKRTAGWAGDRSGEVYATPQRGLDRLPD